MPETCAACAKPYEMEHILGYGLCKRCLPLSKIVRRLQHSEQLYTRVMLANVKNLSLEVTQGLFRSATPQILLDCNCSQNLVVTCLEIDHKTITSSPYKALKTALEDLKYSILLTYVLGSSFKKEIVQQRTAAMRPPVTRRLSTHVKQIKPVP